MMNETTTNSEYQRLVSHLTYLKMDMMIEHLDEVLDQISGQSLSFVEALNKLTQYEIDRKEINMINSMVKVAGFPHRRELKDFDFSFQPSINKEQIMDFSTLRFLENKENIVFLGNSGVGKTHMAVSLGIEAAKKRNSTYFIKCHDLIQQLRKANEENRLENRLKNYSRYKLLITPRSQPWRICSSSTRGGGCPDGKRLLRPVQKGLPDAGVRKVFHKVLAIQLPL